MRRNYHAVGSFSIGESAPISLSTVGSENTSERERKNTQKNKNNILKTSVLLSFSFSFQIKLFHSLALKSRIEGEQEEEE